MATFWGGVEVIRTSVLEIDGDLKVDTIVEKTANAGVTIDGVKCKDNHLFLAAGGFVIWNEELALYRGGADQVGISDYPQTVNTRLVCGNINCAGDLIWAGLRECHFTDDVPGTPEEGDVKTDSTNHRLQFYNATAWKDLTED